MILSQVSYPFLSRLLFLTGILFLLLSARASAQKIQLRLGNPRIAQNEFFTITVSIQDGSLEDLGNFPNIPGFTKAGTSSQSSMQSMNGRVTQEYSLIQNYMPEKQGVFTLAPFSVQVNGQTLKSPGTKIQIGPAKQKQNTDPFSGNPFSYDPFEDFFGGRNQDVPEAKADAIFSIQTDKKEVWAGEGFTITISFLVSEDNQAELSFYDIGNQLMAITKKIKPANCWEENFGIEEIEQRRIKIGKKNYTEYRIYQATLFPLTPGKIDIPALKLEMLANSGGYFGRGKEEIKAFNSRPVQILVKDLPDHPMKGKASVGIFSLEEKPASNPVAIRQGCAYELTIRGEGNISYIQAPEQVNSGMMDIYPPNSRQTIQRAGGRVAGSKSFSYLLIPKEQGRIPLANSLYWVYFNTKTARYDTLKPRTTLVVKQGKNTSASASAQSEDSFYSLMEKVSGKPVDLSERKSASLLWYNLALAIMAVLSLVLMFGKKDKKS